MPNYQDLIDEMVEAIPVYTNIWTDFNPSDPGITILEVLCWVAETLIYKANRISKETYLNFLRLIAGTELYIGTDYLQKELLDEVDYLEKGGNYDATKVVAQVHAYWQSVNLAVSLMDYYNLSSTAYVGEAFMQLGLTEYDVLDKGKLKMAESEDAKSIFVNYDKLSKAVVIRVNPLFVNPENLEVEELDGKGLIKAIKAYVIPRRTVGTIVTVSLLDFVPVVLNTQVVINANHTREAVEASIRQQIERFFSPFYGGISGEGWHPDDVLFQSDLFFVISKATGVEAVTEVIINNDVDITSLTLDGYPILEVDGLQVEFTNP